jgi:hypothetical protein
MSETGKHARGPEQKLKRQPRCNSYKKNLHEKWSLKSRPAAPPCALAAGPLLLVFAALCRFSRRQQRQPAKPAAVKNGEYEA